MFDSVYSSKRIKQCLFTQIRELRSGWNAARLSHCYLAVGEVQAGGRVDECLRTTTTTKSATAALEIKILWHKSILFINQIGILSPLLYIHTYFISHTKLIWMRTTNSFIDIEVFSHSRECIFFLLYPVLHRLPQNVLLGTVIHSFITLTKARKRVLSRWSSSFEYQLSSERAHTLLFVRTPNEMPQSHTVAVRIVFHFIWRKKGKCEIEKFWIK